MHRHIHAELVQGARLYHETPVADGADLLQLVLFTQGYGTWRLHLATGEAYWSPRTYEILGLKFKEGPVDLATAVNCYHEEDAKRLALLIREAVEQSCGFKCVFRVNRPDGEVRLVESAASVRLGASGKSEELYGVFRDVTDEKMAEDISKSRSLVMRSIIEHAPTPTCLIDKSLRYVDVSESWVITHAKGGVEPIKGMYHERVVGALSASWKSDAAKALQGEVVTHANVDLPYYGGNHNAEFTCMIPWVGATGTVNGLILMLASAELALLQSKKKQAV